MELSSSSENMRCQSINISFIKNEALIVLINLSMSIFNHYFSDPWKLYTNK